MARFLSTSTYYHEAIFNEVGVSVSLEDEMSPLSPEAVQRSETVAAQHQGFFVDAIAGVWSMAKNNLPDAHAERVFDARA